MIDIIGWRARSLKNLLDFDRRSRAPTLTSLAEARFLVLEVIYFATTMTTELPLPERFASCSFTPVTKIIASFSPVVASVEGSWSATTYYLDASGRSSFFLPLQLGCRTKEDVDRIVASKCLKPPPQNVQQQDEEESLSFPSFSFRLEAQCHAVEKGAAAVAVEGVTILSTTVEGNSILLDTEVILRAPFKSDSVHTKQSNQSHSGVVKTRLEVTAVLADCSKQNRPVASGLMALELGGGSRPFSGNPSELHSNQTRVGPLSINVSLTYALIMSAKSVGGTSLASTMVSLTMKHSNTHSEPVTITNIALHPAHSRQDALYLKDRSMPGGERSVIDMSKHVKWGYAPQTEPQLPIVLLPYEAYSVIICVEAMNDSRSQTFASPIAVTAVVGDEAESSRRPNAVVTTDAQWTTGRVTVEPSDAFRVELNLRESNCCVGAPFVVSVRVCNLSEATRDLLLVMPKEGDNTKVDSKEPSIPPAVSQANGYTFGVWGISGDEKISSDAKGNNEQDLIAIDSALTLGQVKAQHSINSEIRFVPLRDGSLRIPDFKIYDKTAGKWYRCNHKLSVVALSSKQ